MKRWIAGALSAVMLLGPLTVQASAIQVKVCFLRGVEFFMDVEPTDLVEEFRARIPAQAGFPLRPQVNILVSAYRLENGKTLQEYNIQEGTQIDCMTATGYPLPTAGKTYWFDLSGAGIPGTVNGGNGYRAATVPDPTLHWVPFTYAGEVNAYVLKGRSADDGAAKGDSLTAAGSTDPDDPIGHTYSHSLFLADYAVTHTVSWDGLNDRGMIFGTPYTSGGAAYTLRAPSLGSGAEGTMATSELGRIFALSENYIQNWLGISSWGQDTHHEDAALRGVQGISRADYWHMAPPEAAVDMLGFRPVLELPAPEAAPHDVLKAVTLDLDGGRVGTTETAREGPVEMVVRSSRDFKAPSGKGLTAPAGKVFAGWRGDDGALYSPGDTVPNLVIKLTALWAEETTYSVALSATAGGTASGGGVFAANTQITVTATPDSGYRFQGWTEGGEQVSASSAYTFTVTGDCALVAVFQPSDDGSGDDGPTTYPPRVEQPGEGGGPAAVSPARPERGDTVTVAPRPDEGYETGAVTVTDQRGRPVTVRENPDGTFSFTQPAGRVKITVTYRPAERPWDNPFGDVDEEAWYYEAVRFVLEEGLMVGCGDGRFGPEDLLSRAQLAQILFQKEGRPGAEGRPDFPDVGEGAWYAPAVRWAAGQGIAGGYGSGKFGPDDPITREQLALMLWRYAGRPAPSGLPLAFADGDRTSEYAVDAVRWAVEQGVLAGKGGGLLDPGGQTTRAEAAAMLMRYCRGGE